MKEELEIIKILKSTWSQRKTILTFASLFVLFGIVSALLAPREYKVTTTMILQTESGSGGVRQGLGGLASLAGISSGMRSSDEIPPTLYPQIVSTAPFQLEIINTKITTPKNSSPITFKEYQSKYGSSLGFLGTIKKYTIGLPSTIVKGLKRNSNTETFSVVPEDSLLRINAEDKALMESLAGILDLSVDEENGIVTLSIVMPEAIAAAQMATNAQRLLQEAITDFRIKKIRDQLEYTNDLYDERKAEFLDFQSTLARFRDQHRNISTAMAMNELERHQANYNLAQRIYTDIASQLENMKIKLKENTPSFSVLQPVIVPLQPFKPQRKTIVLTSLLIGLACGLGFVMAKHQYVVFRNLWKST